MMMTMHYNEYRQVIVKIFITIFYRLKIGD